MTDDNSDLVLARPVIRADFPSEQVVDMESNKSLKSHEDITNGEISAANGHSPERRARIFLANWIDLSPSPTASPPPMIGHTPRRKVKCRPRRLFPPSPKAKPTVRSTVGYYFRPPPPKRQKPVDSIALFMEHYEKNTCL